MYQRQGETYTYSERFDAKQHRYFYPIHHAGAISDRGCPVLWAERFAAKDFPLPGVPKISPFGRHKIESAEELVSVLDNLTDKKKEASKEKRVRPIRLRKDSKIFLTRLNRSGGLMMRNRVIRVYNCENYKYLLDAPFKISARCCYHMKKAPLNKLDRKSVV